MSKQHCEKLVKQQREIHNENQGQKRKVYKYITIYRILSYKNMYISYYKLYNEV